MLRLSQAMTLILILGLSAMMMPQISHLTAMDTRQMKPVTVILQPLETKDVVSQTEK